MKTLYLVRHAKSSWKDLSLQDRDRPLNKRGKRDGPVMARHVADKVDCPDQFISSLSRRTQDTAIYFLEAFGRKLDELILSEELFHGYEEDINNVILKTSDKHDAIMLFIHNPGITDYVNELTGADIFNIPTCGVAAITLDTNSWAEIGKCKAELLFYFYPKGLDLPTQN